MTQLIGMYRLALLVLATAYGAVADEEVKENVAAGYFSPVQVDPGYGYDQPSYQQPSYQPPQYYQPPQIVLPPFALPTFDVAYCSVFASFPLVGAKRYKDHRRRGPPGMRRFERQSCRNTAVFSWKSCDTCCKISSRVDEKIPMSSITGALFVFDPDLDFRQNGNMAEDSSNNKAVQCVCCAPKVY
uniref:Ground-like domain-containing protein n=1 Tax=Haemonchus contortus TaxID=6289 RepID=A0A7I4YIR7_HAECO